MKKYEITFTVNGTKSVQIVTANTSEDAKRLILSQYSGNKVYINKITTAK